jgi:hypothetical protein
MMCVICSPTNFSCLGLADIVAETPVRKSKRRRVIFQFAIPSLFLFFISKPSPLLPLPAELVESRGQNEANVHRTSTFYVDLKEEEAEENATMMRSMQRGSTFVVHECKEW